MDGDVGGDVRSMRVDEVTPGIKTALHAWQMVLLTLGSLRSQSQVSSRSIEGGTTRILTVAFLPTDCMLPAATEAISSGFIRRDFLLRGGRVGSVCWEDDGRGSVSGR